MPGKSKKGKKSTKKGTKKVYKGILRQEKKMAKKEVGKAKRMVRKRGKWSVAASAFGYHARVGRSKGKWNWGVGKGGLTEKLQGSVTAHAVPAGSSSIFKPRYDRQPAGKNTLRVSGCQKIGTIGVTSSNGTFGFVNLAGTRVSNFEINPDAIGGQMTFDARNYEYFKFGRIRFIFIMPSTAGTLDAGAVNFANVNLAVAHFQDPRIGSFQTLDFAALQSSSDMFEFQVVQPNGPVAWDLKQLMVEQVRWFNTEQDTNSSASDRMCCQGVIYGFFDQTLASTNAGPFKMGDIIMEYEMTLKGRTPDYGFTMQIGDKKLLEDVYDVVKKREEIDRKDNKDDEFNVNRYMKRYTSVMKHLGEMVKAPIIHKKAGPGIITIADAGYSGDPTKLATVTGNALKTTAGSGSMDCNISKVGGTAVDASVSATGVLPVGGNVGGLLPINVGAVYGTPSGNLNIDIKKILGTTVASGNTILAGSLPVTNQLKCAESGTFFSCQRGTGTSTGELAAVETMTSAGSVGSEFISVANNKAFVANSTSGTLTVGVSGTVDTNLKQIGGTTATSGAELPVNVAKVMGSVLNTFTDGNALNGALPVQLVGRDPSGNAVAGTLQTAFSSGTAADVHLHVTAVTASTNETEACGVSPTESLDGVVIVKKKDYKEALKKGIKMEEQKKPKGPKGPGDENEYDSSDELARENEYNRIARQFTRYECECGNYVYGDQTQCKACARQYYMSDVEAEYRFEKKRKRK